MLNLVGELRLLPRDWRSAAVAGAMCIVGVTAFILALDAIIRPPQSYIAFFTSPLWPRTPLMMGQAVVEEFKYRLLVMTALAWLFSRWRYGVVAAIILSQLVGVWPNVLADPLYASLRFWLVGCVWGWLYWRHGFVTALVAHPLCHLLLDPLLLVAL